MTTTQDLGEVTGTSAEWAERAHRVDGSVEEVHIFNDERRVREIVAFDRRAIERAQQYGAVCGLDGLTDAEIVSRTVTTYATGHKLIGPWEVTE